MTERDPNPDMVANLTAKHTPDQLAAMYLRSELHNAKLSDELSGMLVITRNAAGTITGLKGKRTRQVNEEATAHDVIAILRTWKTLLAPRASIDLEGARADIVRKALKTFTHGDRTQRRRTCMNAVRGLALRPYAGPRGRSASQEHGAQKRHEIRYALMDEEHIEEHAAFYLASLAKPLEWHDRAWTAAIDVEVRYRWMYFQAWKVQLRDQALAPVESIEKPRLFVVPDPEVEAA